MIWNETKLSSLYLMWILKSEVSLVSAYPSSFLHLFFCQNYRREAYFSHCCDPNWPHRNIQTTSGSIWLLSITEYLFFLNHGELQREVNSVLLWRRAISLLSVYGDIEGAAESLGTRALAQNFLITLRVLPLREQVQGKASFKAVFKKQHKELRSYLIFCGWK